MLHGVTGKDDSKRRRLRTFQSVWSGRVHGAFRVGGQQKQCQLRACRKHWFYPPRKILDCRSQGRQLVFAKKEEIHDIANRFVGRNAFGKSDWFALWREDWGIDDYTWIESVKRGNFRLHPGTVSKGCITIANMSDFAMIRNALMSTSLIQVPCMRSLMARGWVEVVAGGYVKKPCM